MTRDRASVVEGGHSSPAHEIPAPLPAWMLGLLEAGQAAVMFKNADQRCIHATSAWQALWRAATQAPPEASCLGRCDDELWPPALASRLKQNLGPIHLPLGPAGTSWRIVECQGETLGGESGVALWWQPVPERRAASEWPLAEVWASTGAAALCPADVFEDQWRRELELSRREHRELALVLLELDDEHASAAHVAAVGDSLRRSTRAMDVASAWGPRGFSVLLSGVGLATAHGRMEAFRRQCASHEGVTDASDVLGTRQGTGSGMKPGLSVSIGVASFPHTSDERGGLMDAAQNALRRAKQRGGNQVVLAPIPFHQGSVFGDETGLGPL